MTDTYSDLIRARAANMALQVLINEHRTALVALIQQPFSPKCVEDAKRVASKPIDTSLGEQHYEEFMELWRQVHGNDDEEQLYGDDLEEASVQRESARIDLRTDTR